MTMSSKTKRAQVAPSKFEIQILRNFPSDYPNFKLSGQINIAEIGDEFAKDFKFGGNLGYPYSD